MEVIKNGFCISTDKSRIDTLLVHEFLSHAYWSEGIPLDVLKKSIRNSLCFGIYKDGKQVGFARVVSDFATYAWLADVFVIPEQRNKGLSKWLMQVIVDHPDLQGLRRFVLATRDAHLLYAQFGFREYSNPERLMSRYEPDVYKKGK